MTDSMKKASISWLSDIGQDRGMLRSQLSLYSGTSARAVAGAWAAGAAQDHGYAAASAAHAPGFTESIPFGGSHIVRSTCIGPSNALPHPEIAVIHKQVQGEPAIELGYNNTVGLAMLVSAVCNVPSGNACGVTSTQKKGRFSDTLQEAVKTLLSDSRLDMRSVCPQQGGRAQVVYVLSLYLMCLCHMCLLRRVCPLTS